MRTRNKVILGILLLLGLYWEYWFCIWWDIAGKGDPDVVYTIYGQMSAILGMLLVIFVWIVMEIRYDLLMERGYVRFFDAATGNLVELPIAEAYGKAKSLHKREDGTYYVDSSWDEPGTESW